MQITGRARPRDFEPEIGQSVGKGGRSAAVWPTMLSAMHSKVWSWNVMMKCREEPRPAARATRASNLGAPRASVIHWPLPGSNDEFKSSR